MNAAEPINGSSALSLEPVSPARPSGASPDVPPRPGAAFFDLDKTVIAKASSLAFSRPLYQGGLLARRDVLKVAYSHLLFRLGGSGDEVQMARTRGQCSPSSRAARPRRRESSRSSTRPSKSSSPPSVYAEAAALIEAHPLRRSQRSYLVSASRRGGTAPIGRDARRPPTSSPPAHEGSATDGRYTGEIDFYARGPRPRPTPIQGVRSPSAASTSTPPSPTPTRSPTSRCCAHRRLPARGQPRPRPAPPRPG